jgi:hypothetical protein
MAAGVTDRLWSVEDLVALWEAYEQRRAERAARMLKTVAIFMALTVTITGLKLLFSPHGSDDQIIGIVLLAAGLTWLWERTGFRGLK